MIHNVLLFSMAKSLELKGHGQGDLGTTKININPVDHCNELGTADFVERCMDS